MPNTKVCPLPVPLTMRLAHTFLFFSVCLSLTQGRAGTGGKKTDGNEENEEANGDWKVLFPNGTIITGVGKPPMLWRLAESKQTSEG